MSNVMTMNKRAPAIKTSEQAIEWLSLNRPGTEIVDGVWAMVPRACGRCGGSGHYSFNLMDGTICFECRGRRPTWTEKTLVVDYARAERAKDNAAAKREAARVAKFEKRLEEERDISEAKGFGRITRPERLALMKAKWAAEAEAKRGVAPLGRVEFTGRVVKVEERDGYLRDTTEIKITLVVTEADGKEWLAWGSWVPGANKGAVVKMTATLKAGREAHFAFFSRPHGAVVVTPAPEETEA